MLCMFLLMLFILFFVFIYIYIILYYICIFCNKTLSEIVKCSSCSQIRTNSFANQICTAFSWIRPKTVSIAVMRKKCESDQTNQTALYKMCIIILYHHIISSYRHVVPCMSHLLDIALVLCTHTCSIVLTYIVPRPYPLQRVHQTHYS